MAITRDQTATSSTNINVPTFTLTWSVNPTAKSKVIVEICSVFATVVSVVDNGTTPTTFTQDASQTAFTNFHNYVFRADAVSLPGAGSYTVTVTLSSNTNAYFASGRSYLGVKAGGPSSTNSATGTTSTAVSSGAVTPAIANALCVSLFGDQSALNPETITLTSAGWSSQASFTNGGIEAGAVADTIVSGFAAQTATWTLGDATSWLALIATYPPAVIDVAAAVDSIRITHPSGDAAAATDRISVIKGTPDAAGAVDSIAVTNVGFTPSVPDAAGAYDVIWVQKLPAAAPTPALATLTQGPLVFVKSQMPRMHVQNLITGAWWHRDVQGITSPSVTWSLNAADSFTCTLSPPRPDMMDSNGEPLLVEWRDACYLEESGEIKWGGILTSSTFNGPAWQQTWTGFSGFPNGMAYEGGVYKKIGVEAMDVVRFLWDWVQSGQGASANLNMQMPTTNTGYLLGAQVQAGNKDTLAANSSKGENFLTVDNPSIWTKGDVLQVTGDGGTYTIKSISGHVLTLTTTLKGASSLYVNKRTLQQVVPPTPYELDWWNNTDIGQEIESIRAEAIFDWRETHAWGSSRDVVKHTWVVGAPRLGMYRQDLRFCEGENIVVSGTVTRDGTRYAQRVVGIGNGQGSSTIRSTVTGSGGRLARSFVYTDQTVKSVARMTSIARKVQQSMDNIDEITQIVVKNHPHAPFGSFFCGDDIEVILCSGWRNTSIKSRITSMTQDPTTNLMTLNLARSDSFTYLAQSGQDGTL